MFEKNPIFEDLAKLSCSILTGFGRGNKFVHFLEVRSQAIVEIQRKKMVEVYNYFLLDI